MNPDDPFDAEAMIAALAPLLGILVRPDYVAGIAANLDTAAEMAALLEQVSLDDEAEPAPVFTA